MDDNLAISVTVNSLIMGTPVQITGESNQAIAAAIASSAPELSELVLKYGKDLDIVSLYESVSRLSIDQSCLPSLFDPISFSRHCKQLSIKYKCTDITQEIPYSCLSFTDICDWLNPLRYKKTYVIKRTQQCRMYEELITSNSYNSMLEMGVFYGGSLHAWKLLLPSLELYALDINPPLQDSKILERLNCHFKLGSSVDRTILDYFIAQKQYDIIVDDASHHPSHQINSFIYLTSHNAWSKSYIIEDFLDYRYPTDLPLSNFINAICLVQEGELDVRDFALQHMVDSDGLTLQANINYKSLDSCLRKVKLIRYGNNCVFSY